MPSTASVLVLSKARCSASWARTAPVKPPPSKSSKACANPTPAILKSAISTRLKEPQRIKELIGVQLQATSLYDNIRVKEAIDLFGSYYQKSLPAEQIMEEVSLTEKKNSQVSKLSGGQKQRLSVGLALVNDPEVIFLDEPTTGLDPQARHNIWSIVEKLRERGKTVVMTTHYMEEAEQLCHRLAIIDQGQIIAMDTPENLINKAGLATSIDFTTSQELDGLAKISPVSVRSITAASANIR